LLRRACQIVLTASSALLFLAFGSSGILSAGVTALLVSAMPVVLVLLASSPRQSRRLTAALLTLWLVLAGSFCGVIWLSRAGLSATRVAGIPLSLGLLLVGLGLAPLALVTWTYAATFDEMGISDSDLESIRGYSQRRMESK
jgi:drug/metabolite transporter (DMT)-like permease